MSLDGTLMVTDGMSRNVGGKGDAWGIMVADMKGGQWVLLHSFAQSGGAIIRIPSSARMESASITM